MIKIKFQRCIRNGALTFINYYRKYGFRHLPKLNGDVQNEDKQLEQLADNNLNFKFTDDIEMEDFMWVEIVERM